MRHLMPRLMPIVGICCLFSCTSDQPRFDADISVVIDRTSPMAAFPTAEEIVSAAGLSTNEWLACNFVLTAISDKDINTTYSFALGRESRLLGNSLRRKSQVVKLKKDLGRCLELLRVGSGRPRSIVYRTIARQCGRLTASPASSRLIAVYSDFQENCEVSLYSDAARLDLSRSPQVFEQRLTGSDRPPPLPGLRVQLIYEPNGYDDNSRYMAVASFYSRLLERRGASVQISNKLLAP